MNDRKINNLPPTPLGTAAKNRNAPLWRTFTIYITAIRMRPSLSLLNSMALMDDEVTCPPFESNPDIIASFVSDLTECERWKCADIFSLDVESEQYLPGKAVAIFLLYPMQTTAVERNGRSDSPEDEILKQVVFIKQMVKNSCGPVAIMHALSNVIKDETLATKTSWMHNFLKNSRYFTPDERGRYLSKDRMFNQLCQVYGNSGDSEPVESDANVPLHFVCYVEVDKRLYRLDGRKSGPEYLGPVAGDNFFATTMFHCKQFVDILLAEESSVEFNAMALCIT
ncbi:Ubiquitin carboxyl-terminal hydrolase isozyme L3 [Trichinella murrelli]|uniref:Ubiquitin carboxyl-terminal hydrolase n=1 Tax=Trichinella murrelli TaxID=144512 RepID=A0A0V0U5B5_9BILA|nr:Ubiquitin carboxyl-terminal hydrolase isozyme L3 [Trichinella murrelli]